MASEEFDFESNRWATLSRGERMSQGYQITINGVTHNQSEWCRIYHIDPSTVRSRVEKGMSIEEALTKKTQYGHRRRIPSAHVGKKEKPTDYGYKMIRSKKCKDCYYSERADSQWVCMYIVIHPEHHRRGCPAGDKCNKFEPKKGRVRVTEAEEVFRTRIFG